MSESIKNNLDKLKKYYDLRMALDEVIEKFSIDLETLTKESVSGFIKILAKNVFDGEMPLFDSKVDSDEISTNPEENNKIGAFEDPVFGIHSPGFVACPPDDFFVFLQSQMKNFNNLNPDCQIRILSIYILKKNYANYWQKKYSELIANKAPLENVFKDVLKIFSVELMFKKICDHRLLFRKVKDFIDCDDFQSLNFGMFNIGERTVFDIFCLHYDETNVIKIFPRSIYDFNNGKFFSCKYDDYKSFNKKMTPPLDDSSEIKQKPSGSDCDWVVLFRTPFLYTDKNGQYFFYGKDERPNVFQYHRALISSY